MNVGKRIFDHHQNNNNNILITVSFLLVIFSPKLAESALLCSASQNTFVPYQSGRLEFAQQYPFAFSGFHIFPQLRIPCDGYLTSWRFLTTVTSISKLHLAVVRIAGTKDALNIISDTLINDFQAPDFKTGAWVSYRNDPPILVKTGDVLAYFYDRVTIPHDERVILTKFTSDKLTSNSFLLNMDATSLTVGMRVNITQAAQSKFYPALFGVLNNELLFQTTTRLTTEETSPNRHLNVDNSDRYLQYQCPDRNVLVPNLSGHQVDLANKFPLASANLHIFPQLRVPCDGYLTHWRLLTKDSTNEQLYLAVFRRSTRDQFDLVGQTLITSFKSLKLPRDGTWITYKIDAPISVQAGDFLGFFYSTLKIEERRRVVLTRRNPNELAPYAYVFTMDRAGLLARNQRLNISEAFTESLFPALIGTLTSARMLSMESTTAAVSQQCPSENAIYVPHNPRRAEVFAEEPSLLSSKLHIFPELRIPCDGFLTNWRFLTTHHINKPLHLAVFRPTENTAVLEIVADTVIANLTAPTSETGTWVTYRNKPPIPVETDDFLGFFYDELDLPYDERVIFTQQAPEKAVLAAYVLNIDASNLIPAAAGSNRLNLSQARLEPMFPALMAVVNGDIVDDFLPLSSLAPLVLPSSTSTTTLTYPKTTEKPVVMTTTTTKTTTTAPETVILSNNNNNDPYLPVTLPPFPASFNHYFQTPPFFVRNYYYNDLCSAGRYYYDAARGQCIFYYGCPLPNGQSFNSYVECIAKNQQQQQQQQLLTRPTRPPPSTMRQQLFLGVGNGDFFSNMLPGFFGQTAAKTPQFFDMMKNKNNRALFPPISFAPRLPPGQRLNWSSPAMKNPYSLEFRDLIF